MSMHDHTGGSGAAPTTSDKTIDPVCGMIVDPATMPHHAEHEGVEYHFCSAGCRTKFLADPGRHLHPEQAAPSQPPPPGTRYTCPMHPQIEQDGPGTCPICGMALEPLLPSLDEGENPELTDFRRRFWWTLPLSVATMVLGTVPDAVPSQFRSQLWENELESARPHAAQSVPVGRLRLVTNTEAAGTFLSQRARRVLGHDIDLDVRVRPEGDRYWAPT